MKKKISAITIVRRIIQLAAFLVWPGLFLSVFSTMKSIVSAIVSGSFSFPVYAAQIFLLIAVLVLTALFGRFFCGFLCAFGSLGDAVWFVSRKTMKKRLSVAPKAEKWLKLLKYLILAFLVLFVWILAVVQIPSDADPWNIFGMYAVLGNWPAASALISVGGALLLLILVGSFFIERFFCRYLCPLGAVFSLISHFRIFRIQKPRADCGACKACSLHCPMGIPMGESDEIKSGECIDCFSCVTVCPRKNICTTVAGQETSPLAAGAVAAAAITGLSYLGTWAGGQIAASQGVQVSSGAVQSAGYVDGTYTGTGTGYRGDVTVQVTVENGSITAVEVLSYRDDSQYFNLAQNGVISQILAKQSAAVTAVSGATFSSNGIMEAVANALANDSSDYGASSDSSSEVPQQPDTSSPDAPSADSEPSSQPAASGSFTDGTYTGSGTGFRGTTKVTVTVKNGAITAITVDSYQDDERFFTTAQSTVISEIISQQTVSVNAASGATFSSNGIMEAVANALGVDFTNPNGTTQGGHGGHGKH